jgi:hypothetical protein
MKNKLTEDQTKFLSALFTTCMGDLKKAANEAIGTEDYSSLVDDALLSELKKKSDREIQLSAAKATFILRKVLDHPEDLVFFKDVAKVASDILDRAGISRQERSVSHSSVLGLVFLPPKAELPPPPPEEKITIDSVPLPEMLRQ